MYLSLNRATGRNMIMYSTEGGMDIEEVTEHTHI
jgi:succinyl-CoA synthetase beta subunit